MNTFKKILILLIVICLQTAGICTFAASTGILGAGTQLNPYRISNSEQLLWFADLVNGTLSDGGEKNTSACAILTADIVINEEDLSGGKNLANATVWTPMGNENSIYTGEFNGNGKSIKGLYIKDGTYRGLFGCTSGRITNLTVENSYIDGATKGCNAGAIAGKIENGIISGCDNKSYVSGGNETNTGGVAGVALNTEIYNCTNYGKVESRNDYDDGNIGGIVGYSGQETTIRESVNNGTLYLISNEARHNNFGGIAGCTSASTISNCENKNKVTSYGRNNNVGGIAGYNGENSNIVDSLNNGSVTGYRDDCIGGVVGENNASIVSGCSNNEDVQYTDSYVTIGGIAAYNKNGGVITDCKNTYPLNGLLNNIAGIVTYVSDSIVENCYNEGEISGNRSGKIGGIVAGMQGNSIIRNCYNTAKVSGINGGTSGGIASSAIRTENRIENCFNIGSNAMYPISITDNITTVNCYYMSESETDTKEGTTFKTSAQFASGEVCYLLNGEQSNIVFYQIIGFDAFPSFNGDEVYYSEENGYHN